MKYFLLVPLPPRLISATYPRTEQSTFVCFLNSRFGRGWGWGGGTGRGRSFKVSNAFLLPQTKQQTWPLLITEGYIPL